MLTRKFLDSLGGFCRSFIWFWFKAVVVYVYVCYWCLKKGYILLFGEGHNNMAMDVSKIGKNLIKCVATGENVTIESLWKEQTCVITFLRRFG